MHHDFSNWIDQVGPPPDELVRLGFCSGRTAAAADILAETVDGGQSFRWHRHENEIWTGCWADCVTPVQRLRSGRLEWRAPESLRARIAAALPHYLALDTDWAAHIDTLPWRSDPHLAECIRAFPGLRLLRQPFGETLLGFLCSATKQIVQIKQMVALLAERHGAEICRAGSLTPPKVGSFTRGGVGDPA